MAWWARRNLRINEEICCDALVLSSLEPKRRTYANALMTVVEFLSAPVIHPPAMASEINSGGFLERRFKVIMSGRPFINTPRWLVALILLCASGLLPLGVALADRPDREDGSARIEANEDAGVNIYFNRLGVSRETMDRIRSALGEGGLTEEQFEPVLGGMLRVIGEMQAEGENFELDLWLGDTSRPRSAYQMIRSTRSRAWPVVLPPWVMRSGQRVRGQQPGCPDRGHLMTVGLTGALSAPVNRTRYISLTRCNTLHLLFLILSPAHCLRHCLSINSQMPGDGLHVHA